MIGVSSSSPTAQQQRRIKRSLIRRTLGSAANAGIARAVRLVQMTAYGSSLAVRSRRNGTLYLDGPMGVTAGR